MLEMRTGTRIWIAAGVTDMRRGFPGLSAQVQTILKQQPFYGHVFVFAVVAATRSRFYGPMKTAHACLRSDWSADALSGRKRRRERFL
jgi:hypothetical protein